MFVVDFSPETPSTVVGPPVSLSREEDLKPKMNDLDNIFESDSESSEADHVSIHHYTVIYTPLSESCYNLPMFNYHQAK